MNPTGYVSDPQEREALALRIVSMLDYLRALRPHPAQGQLVLTGIQMGSQAPERRIGYCVQVRKGRGQFGSDMVFLRHPHGGLTTHENQSYYSLSPEAEAMARRLYEEAPEAEDYSHGYSCFDKVHEKGFIVENSASVPAPPTPFRITVTGADGVSSLTEVR